MRLVRATGRGQKRMYITNIRQKNDMSGIDISFQNTNLRS